jgi:diguanylate cyclase (GGDEF)-like protein/PAS domain S-box-containing protein
MEINQKNLPRLILSGMLALILLLTLSLGSFYTLRFLADEAERTAVIEEQALATHRALLKSEIEGVQDFINFTRSRTEKVLKNAVRAQTDQAYQVAEAIWQREKGRLPAAEIRKLIVEALRNVRFFEGRGYVFIDDMAGNCILLPTAPKLEGTSFWNNQDDTGHYIMRGLIDAVRNKEGAGYSSYRWYSPDNPTQMSDKIAYVRHFAPFDWVIGTGEYLYKIEEDLQAEALQRFAARRFAHDGYVAIVRRLIDGDLELLANPNSPSVGKRLSQLPADSDERRLLKRFTEIANNGGDFANYQWPSTKTGEPTAKMALISDARQWGWILIATVHLDDVTQMVSQRQAEATQTAWENARGALLIGLISILTALALTWFYSRWLAGLFRNYQADIDRQHRQLREHAKQRQLASRVFENGQEAIFITDAEETIIDVNSAFERLTGYRRDEIIGQKPGILASGRHSPEFYQSMRQALEVEGGWSGEIWNRRKDGSIFPEWQTISAVLDEHGQVSHYISSFTDMTERKDAEERLRRMAEYDGLTGLPNRHLLTDRAEQARSTAQRRQRHIALMFLDLDRFKNINDTLGHGCGDTVLNTIAERLQQNIRNADTASRIGGDEFVVLLSDIEHPDDAALVAGKLLEQIGKPFEVDGHLLEITPSIGIAIYPEDGEDVDTLLKHADAAMYHAKAEGRNNFQFFTDALNERIQARFIKENLLRQAVDRGEMRLHFQPQIALRTGDIVGCEALVRWQHPVDGLLPPAAFIDLAEESGIIHGIGNWVLREACQQAAAWLGTDSGFQLIAVNVSPQQLRNPDFLAEVERALADAGLPASALELEITENLLVDRNEQLLDTLWILRKKGVRLALDDFGTGYSNLAYLKQFPLHRLKIDRSFVSDIPHDALDATLTTAIAGLADNFGLAVIAEGVETIEQRDFLVDLGCDEAQGFFFHKPMPAEDFSQLLAAQLAARSST